MEIVYAAEKDSIATLLSEQLESAVLPQDIAVCENPDKTGSFFVGFDTQRFLLTPSGQLIGALQTD